MATFLLGFFHTLWSQLFFLLHFHMVESPDVIIHDMLCRHLNQKNYEIASFLCKFSACKILLKQYKIDRQVRRYRWIQVSTWANSKCFPVICFFLYILIFFVSIDIFLMLHGIPKLLLYHWNSSSKNSVITCSYWLKTKVRALYISS